MLEFHFPKPGKGRKEAELIGVCRIDAAQQRLDHAVQRLLSQSAPKECCQRLILSVAVSREKQLGGNTKLRRPRQQASPQKWPELARYPHHDTLRQFLQPALKEDKSLTMLGVCGHEAVGQAESAAQVDPPRFLSQKRLRASFNNKTVSTIGKDFSAESWGGLKERTTESLAGRRISAGAFIQRVGCRQPGDSGADDDNVTGDPRHASSRRQVAGLLKV